MTIDTSHFSRCIEILQSSLALLSRAAPQSVEYEVFRNAVVKGFELTLETAAKLLRRALKAYAGAPRSVDQLAFKDVLRHAAKHGLLAADEVPRWFAYRDNRNNTAHDDGIGFAEQTLALLSAFVEDARRLESALRQLPGDD